MDTGIERTRDSGRLASRSGHAGRRPAGSACPGRGERLRNVLGELFPAVPDVPRLAPGRRVLVIAAQLVAVAAGAAVLLERIPGVVPPWDTVYAEDYWLFLIQAIQHPWHLFIAYNNYEQIVPRLIAQFALFLPLAQASRFFAVAGAVIAAACGLFVYHATAGHVHSRVLRAVLGAGVVLLAIAPMEIADSGVDSVWYLLIAGFWALLWRPRTRTGVALAAIVAFFAAASNILVVLLVPLVALRLFVLRRPREHVVSVAWLVGCLIQAYEVLSGHTTGQDRLTEQAGTLHSELAFYAHDVVLRSLGWHLSWHLQDIFGRNGATAVVGVVLVVVFGAILLTQPRNRPFVVTAVAIGFLLTMFSIQINGPLGTKAVLPDLEPGARYSALPIFLFECCAVIAVDYLLRKRVTGAGHRRPRVGARSRIGTAPAIAAVLLVVVLGASWVADFRYPGYRSNAVWNWAPIAAKWEQGCEQSHTGVIREWVPVAYQELPCANMHF